MSTVQVDVAITLDRQTALYSLLKSFVECSVILRGTIESDLRTIDKILNACVKKNKSMKKLEIWYLTETPSGSITKHGQVIFSIDWQQHSAEIQSGNDKFIVSEDDILGSINPLFRKFADALRGRALRDGVNQLHFSVYYVDAITANDNSRQRLNKELGLVTDMSEKMSNVHRTFDESKREQIVIRTEDLRDIKTEAEWIAKP